MAIYNKIKWVLGILIVFVIIVCTNLIDRNNFIRVKDSVVTIYEDRLIAHDIIVEMLIKVQEKELAYATKDSSFFEEKNSEVNTKLNGLISRYEQTKLTTEEQEYFEQLKTNFETLFTIESSSTPLQNSGVMKSIKENLNHLSKVQLNEGNRQMTISKRAINTVELFTEIEIYLLAFLAIVIQIIIMYNPKKKEG